MTVDPGLLHTLESLPLEPRGKAWTSLSYCVFDAVWSMGSQYRAVVVPLVWRLARSFGDERPRADAAMALPADPLRLSALLDMFPTVAGLQEVTNRQRTSTRGGIPKADAVLRFAAILTRPRGQRSSSGAAALRRGRAVGPGR